nr:A disintegrin and metalloproteinase with thrombospondin motifs adt-2-like isoform X2 [Styela clava]
MANNMEDCPVEIEPSKTWGPWSTCSATCNGNRIRQKLCNSQACPDGIPYYGLCNTDCGVIAPSQHTTWSQWTECSETCDGIRTRQRLRGNTFCETSSPVKEECNIGRCGDPSWVWSNWLQCTATCEGTRTRYKLCGQALCYGKDPATRECNTNPCSGSEGYSYSSTLYTTTTTGSYLSTMYTSTPRDPIYQQCTQQRPLGHTYQHCTQQRQQQTRLKMQEIGGFGQVVQLLVMARGSGKEHVGHAVITLRQKQRIVMLDCVAQTEGQMEQMRVRFIFSLFV